MRSVTGLSLRWGTRPGALPVIAQQIALDEPCLRPVDFLQVRDLNGLVSQLPRFGLGVHADVLPLLFLLMMGCTLLNRCDGEARSGYAHGARFDLRGC
jgi:hypothetical protein